MPERTVRVASSVGLHARPAAVIAEAAASYDTPITLRHGSQSANASSALLIMLLGAHYGDHVSVECDDPAALNRICELIARELDPRPQQGRASRAHHGPWRAHSQPTSR